MKKKLFEGLDYHDLVGQMEPIVSVDEYAAKMGKDSDIVTIAFVVKSKSAGEDLCDWFERGYDFVLDAQVSEGELSKNKYLVFVEMSRRTKVPERIVELINDLETLTDLPLKEWTVKVNDENYDADKDVLSQVIVLSPKDYKVEVEKEEELNEMREIAGLQTKNIHSSTDDLLKNYKSIAGL